MESLMTTSPGRLAFDPSDPQYKTPKDWLEDVAAFLVFHGATPQQAMAIAPADPDLERYFAVALMRSYENKPSPQQAQAY